MATGEREHARWACSARCNLLVRCHHVHLRAECTDLRDGHDMLSHSHPQRLMPTVTEAVRTS
eukprot:6189278-Pleurochrysis_carterae.AAC.3